MTPNAEVTPNHKATPGEDKPRGGCAGFVGVEAIAGFLGLTEEQLHTELQAEGATLASVAAAHGQDRDALKAFLTDQVATRLAGKVAEGDLTQEEADQRLSEFTSNLDSILDGTVPAGRGFHGRFPTPGGEWEGGSNGSSGTFSRGEGRS
jgi:hypothetical protein